MPAPHVPPCPASPSFDRIAAQIGVARELALEGRSAPARRLCGALFLDHLMLIMQTRTLLHVYLECLLLLEMSALLPRVLQAVFGVELVMAKVGNAGAEKWTLSFGNGVTLLMPRAQPQMDRALRKDSVGLWAYRVLAAAAEDGREAVLPRDLSGMQERRETALTRRAEWSVAAGLGAER